MSPETFSEFWQIYQQAFPSYEKRSLDEEIAILQNKFYQIIPYYQPNSAEMTGFAAVWNLPSFTFIEHLAIKNQYRGLGWGTKIVKQLQQESLKPLILEVEPPLGSTACRRICFYEKLGFWFNNFAYVQPPYGNGRPVQLKIMSYPEPLTWQDFKGVRGTLYVEVYHAVK